MNWKIIKTYYIVVLNILTGLLISVAPPIVQTPTAGTSLVFCISLIALPILILIDKTRLRTYLQILTIFDGFIALTGLIILISGFVEIFVTLLIIGLYAPASFFGYEILKQKGKK